MTALDVCVYTLLPLSYGIAWSVSRFVIGRSARIQSLLDLDGSSRRKTIDGLRGLFSIAILVNHLLPNYQYLRAGVWPPQPIRYLLTVGESGVVIFFMITAFLFWGRILDVRTRMNWPDYFIRRIFRLTPLYFVFVAALIAIALGQAGGHLVEPLSAFVRQAGAWFAYTVRAAPNVNHMRPVDTLLTTSVVWSLVYEWIFYIALPLPALVFARTRSIAAAAMSATVFTALLFLGGRHGHGLLLNRSLPFLPGMLVAWLIRRERVRKLAATGWFGAVALLSVAGVAALAPSGYDTRALPFLTIFFLAAAAENRWFGCMRSAAARWLGEVSYGTYLFHLMALWLAEGFVAKHVTAGRDPALWLQMVVLVVVSGGLIVFVSGTHLAIERPGIALGRIVSRKLLPRRAPEAPPAAGQVAP